MPWAVREYDVIGVETLNDIRRGSYLGVFETEDEALSLLDELLTELKEELESDPKIAIIDEDEFGFSIMEKKELEEIMEETEGMEEPELSGYDYIGYEVEEVSEGEAEEIRRKL
jgi:C4-type Zn-finger protein